MVDGWGVSVEADFENVIVVRGYTEARDKAVDVQVQILAYDVLTS